MEKWKVLDTPNAFSLRDNGMYRSIIPTHTYRYVLYGETISVDTYTLNFGLESKMLQNIFG